MPPRAPSPADAELLEGAVDVHVHGGPDVLPRHHTDTDLARRARGAGMAAIVIKCHNESTVGRAAGAAEATGFRVAGGIVLNPAVTGGVDPDVVLNSLDLGARVIWMPTLAAAGHLREFPGVSPGANRVAPRPARVPRSAVKAICAHVARADAFIATGHLGRAQATLVAEEAAAAGARVLFQHPDYTVPALGLRTQAALAERFPHALFERCAFVVSPGAPRPTTIGHVAAAIRAVGPGRNVISSDLGQPANGDYPHRLAGFARDLVGEGLLVEEVRAMLVDRPAALLGS